MNNLRGKKILIGVCGGIAAYKAADLVSELKKRGVDVWVCMTESATKFIGPLTLKSLSGNPVGMDVFGREDNFPHLQFGKDFDLAILFPATANTIAHISHGFAQNILELAVLTLGDRVWVCPAMNTKMYAAIAVKENLAKLRARGMKILGPEEGVLACGEKGLGRLVGVKAIIAEIERKFAPEIKAIINKKVLITAGPTREYLDDVRYLSNISSGRLGDLLSLAFLEHGCEVSLLSGKSDLNSGGRLEMVNIGGATALFNEVKKRGPEADIIICAAAVSDISFNKFSGKIKKNDLKADFFVNNAYLSPDCLAYCGENKNINQLVVGFALEEELNEALLMDKCYSKSADILVGNLVSDLSSPVIEAAIYQSAEKSLKKWEKLSKEAFVDRFVSFLGQLSML